MIKNTLILLTFGLGTLISCKHDPFPAPPDGMAKDTIKNPVDTTTPKGCDPDTVYYNRDIQPLLTANCAYSGCHDAGTATEGVILNSYTNVINTADVRPFDLNGSDLYEVITDTDPDKRMPPPPNTPLSQSQIALIATWINQGALNLECEECDTLNLTYTNGIKSIFDQNCVNCHGGSSPSAGLLLNSYNNVKDALNGSYDLLVRINGGNSTDPVMPQGGKMPECNIDKIEAWYNDGMPQ